MSRFAIGIFLAFAPVLASPVVARDQPEIRLAMNEQVTSRVIRGLESGRQICQKLPATYQFDCYSKSYQQAAGALSGKPDYSDARRAFSSVASDMNKVVRQNLDPSQDKIRVSGRTYRAVKPAAVDQARAVYDRSREEAQSVLLRSNDRASVHYARFAEVVGSSKILMRAGLMILRGFA